VIVSPFYKFLTFLIFFVKIGPLGKTVASTASFFQIMVREGLGFGLGSKHKAFLSGDACDHMFFSGEKGLQ